jgi:hypothetical protein
VARARERSDAYDLIDAGAHHVVRETFGSALDAGVQVLEGLGIRRYRAHRLARAFARHDERFLREVAATRHEVEDFFSMIRKRRAEVERTLKADLGRPGSHLDAAWDVQTLRAEMGSSSGAEGPVEPATSSGGPSPTSASQGRAAPSGRDR